MVAEPPSVLVVSAPDKEAEIAVPTTALTETIHYLFAVLPLEKQGGVLTRLAEQIREKDAAIYTQTMNRINGNPILSIAGSLKDHPAWEDYQRIMQEQREERRKEAELLYPDEVAALHPLAASFSALKDDPLWDEYETALREIKEEDKRRTEEMYPVADNGAV